MVMTEVIGVMGSYGLWDKLCSHLSTTIPESEDDTQILNLNINFKYEVPQNIRDKYFNIDYANVGRFPICTHVLVSANVSSYSSFKDENSPQLPAKTARVQSSGRSILPGRSI